MTKTNKATMKMAREMVGCSVFHDGEEGTIVGAEMMAEPMVVVVFGGRRAILKPSELGAK